jgi:heme-degrading monooxygenase HmoA
MPTSASSIVPTPDVPYYAVIFTSQRAKGDHGYEQMADQMLQLASQQPGFLGAESLRDANGFGITVSYWSGEKGIADWKAHSEHKPAQEAGKRTWYADYQLRVAKVTRAYGKESHL